MVTRDPIEDAVSEVRKALDDWHTADPTGFDQWMRKVDRALKSGSAGVSVQKDIDDLADRMAATERKRIALEAKHARSTVAKGAEEAEAEEFAGLLKRKNARMAELRKDGTPAHGDPELERIERRCATIYAYQHANREAIRKADGLDAQDGLKASADAVLAELGDLSKALDAYSAACEAAKVRDHADRLRPELDRLQRAIRPDEGKA